MANNDVRKDQVGEKHEAADDISCRDLADQAADARACRAVSREKRIISHAAFQRWRSRGPFQARFHATKNKYFSGRTFGYCCNGIGNKLLRA